LVEKETKNQARSFLGAAAGGIPAPAIGRSRQSSTGVAPSSHLSGIGLYLMLAASAPKRATGRSRGSPERHRRAGLGFSPASPVSAFRRRRQGWQGLAHRLRSELAEDARKVWDARGEWIAGLVDGAPNLLDESLGFGVANKE
jgi:hypothetical protein